MRYIDKQLYDSMQFYNIVINIHQTYEEYCTKSLKYYKNIQQIFEKNFKERFTNNIMYKEEVVNLILNYDGSIKYLSQDIYDNLQLLARKYKEYQIMMFNKVYSSADIIAESNCSNGIKEIARLRLHDDTILSMEYKNFNLNITIRHGGIILIYDFRTVNNWDGEILNKFIGNTILYEEIFASKDKTFEYNLLFHNNKFNNFYELSDISIIFYDASVSERKTTIHDINLLKRIAK